jgi:glycosyltransferase involved in cell wall biosynthesis
VPSLCRNLAARGNSVEVCCLAAKGSIDGVALAVYPQWARPKRFAVSPQLGRSLWRNSRTFDVIHNHSLWSMANVAVGWAPRGDAILVTSPRGTLSKWALSRSSSLKRLIWPIQNRAIFGAELLHATSREECQDIRAVGFRGPVAIIPNGIDVVPVSEIVQAEKFERSRTVLFLSRIHPKKGIDLLLKAWAQVEVQHPDWELVIAGTGEASHVAEMSHLAVKLGVKRARFPGPLYGGAKSAAYTRAAVFVLPTHSENFGMVVAEALAHGCPAIVSKGAPWSGLQENRCGWWTENDRESLTAALLDAMSRPMIELTHMGMRGRAWMERDYGWAGIAQKMEAAYRWVRSGGAMPNWIYTD